MARVAIPARKSRKKAIGGCRFTGTIRVFHDAIQVPRLGVLRLKEHGYLPTTVKISSATISEKAGRWSVSICVHHASHADNLPPLGEEEEGPRPATGEAIGVDLGIKMLATLSDGRTFKNPKALRKKITALKRASRRHSRKPKGSANRQKARMRLARMHARIAHVRQNALHQATAQIVARTRARSRAASCDRPRGFAYCRYAQEPQVSPSHRRCGDV
ncbi:RNA-guided endonuclease InsQ/TnpB family protein [Ktedonospora formicarum]|uniref:Probable transposase IS891/IS1136/IS1341 domain-containing protein n=1 Tax=Ktedonospora formicarum TaxID=2778364 RepID=A0A8J3I9M5_9CHLR|nr:RNA-guided endonuclease TnpB family protein [Ktedonospora formicarum]GHO48303.1 hypothetical protein KSX_64660 [Ktedonospora formicarum]